MRKNVARAGAWLGAIALLGGGISACFGATAVVSVEVGFIGGVVIIASSLLSALRVVASNSSFASGHSALSDKSAINKARGVDEPLVLSPCSPCQSPDFSSQILECQAESSPKDSKEVSESTFSESRTTSESTPSLTCEREPKQSTDSNPHASLESKADSKPTSAVGHSSTAIESSFSSKRCSEQALKASPLSSGKVASDCKGEGASLLAVAQPQTHTCTFKPLPLNKKEKKESEEVLESQKVKALDSEGLDSESKRLTSRDISNFRPQYDRVSESKNKAESAMVGDSEKRDSDSKNLESATDSESRNLASRDTSLAAQYDNKLDSKHPKDSHTPQETQAPKDSTNASFASRFILGTRLSFSLLRLVAYALFIFALLMSLKYQLFSLAWFFGGFSVGVCALIILVARTLLTQARQTHANIAKK